tara:strand:- start:22 stop:495 length:474 start_codon:yes stop_codon:yes gene_type:complete
MSIDIKSLPLGQRKTYKKQDKFLKCYSETRSRSVSASYAGVSLASITQWIKKDYLEFQERYEEADTRFCEGLEQLALERVKLQDAKSNPVLLITLLNANLPHKYRPTVVMTDDTAKGVLTELRKLAKETPVLKTEEEKEKTALEQVNEILTDKGGMA